MSFFLGFICGLIVGGVMTHLAHEYMDAMLFKKEEPDPPLWMRSKDEEKE